MSPEERQLLANLFERVKGAANTPRDKEAEAFIADAVRQQPYAPYMMAQTVIVQEEALKAAASRIQELEAQLADHARERDAGSTSFLGGLGKSIFGGQDQRPPQQQARPAPGPWGQAAQPQGGPPPAPGPWGAPAQPQGGGFFGGGQGGPMGGGGGGGFLRGAMTTAAGVAGGALLFQGISSLFNSHHGASGLFGGQAGALDPAALGGTTIINNEYLGSDQPPPDQDIQSAGYDDGSPDDGSIDDAGYDDGGSADDGDSWA
ncbi:DUF2076 domain-containing protein [Alsobacter soli]|uniref:DUF2076 domain-containing protein n=1 Tax=Alsobacter soli TaxID=2109933 RepID=A0A2T1HSF8_9HYPH|nr:DUF2076 domain-containing protein [Alsobacter soli]PSC04584.1 DUF2076 domain-containing protein [Alsobacter soli]